MTQTFPLALADFALTLPVKHFAWKLQEQQDVDGLAGGNPLVTDMAPRYWKARVQLDSMGHQEAAEIQSMIESLDGGLSKFYFHDPRQWSPYDDPKGLILAAGTAVALGGEAGFGSFPTSIFRAEGNSITLSQSLSIVADAGTYFDSYGVLQLTAANASRIDYGPFANYVRNPRAQGGVPGTTTLPTFMSVFASSGLSHTFLGTGITDGIDWFDLRIFGTPTNSFFVLAFDGAGAPAQAGQTWTERVFGARVAGLMTGISNIYTSLRQAGGATPTFETAFNALTSVLVRQPAATGTLVTGATAAIPALYLNVVIGTYLDITLRLGFQTLERAGVASAYPRSPLCMLADPAASNKVARSREFDNAAWTKVRTTVTPNVAGITDPWGTALAEKLVEDGTAGASHYVHQVYTTTNYVNHVGYVLAKAGERSKIRLEISNFTTTSCWAVFDLAAGTVGAASSGSGDFTGATASIIPLGNGWYWCEIEALKTAGNNNCYLTVGLCDAAGNQNYNGDGTSGAYLAHAQLEEGLTGRMPIVTTTAAAARAADQLTFKGKGVNDFLLTFDDGSTQSFPSQAAPWSPTSSSFSRSRIRSWAATRRNQPAPEAVRIAEVSANNKEVRLKGLPSGYRVGRSGMFHRDYGANPVHRGLYRTNKKLVTADAAGETDWLEFRPHFIPGSAAVDDVIALVQPAALCMVVPGSLNEGQPAGARNYGMSFDIIQVP